MMRSSRTRSLIPSPSTAPAAATATATVTLENASSSSDQQPQITDSLVLKLKPPRKRVSWKEGTVDNEFMNKKSSKKCCIFHKEKPFDEDDSGSEGEGDGCCHDRESGGKYNHDRNNHNHGGEGNCYRVP
ncbi:protein phosphatase 1 regulatory subunit INH3-like [Andrographis paniculata]|uniref:protein phosphatase 1 regulatory subunit INH3-like n=1 Tax=Andrographis paniculata TaxID=175694 RepID=UPI0021E7FE32|nr:protein phosphatase 1 regulatory subunit INH3-like [Andrographis paniculata]